MIRQENGKTTPQGEILTLYGNKLGDAMNNYIEAGSEIDTTAATWELAEFIIDIVETGEPRDKVLALTGLMTAIEKRIKTTP